MKLVSPWYLLQILGKHLMEFAYKKHINKYQCHLKKNLSSWLRKCGNCSSPPSACGNCTTQCQQGALSKLQQLKEHHQSHNSLELLAIFLYIIFTLNLVCDLLAIISSRSVTPFWSKQPKFLWGLFVHCNFWVLEFTIYFSCNKKIENIILCVKLEWYLMGSWKTAHRAKLCVNIPGWQNNDKDRIFVNLMGSQSLILCLFLTRVLFVSVFGLIRHSNHFSIPPLSLLLSVIYRKLSSMLARLYQMLAFHRWVPYKY